MTNHQPYRTHYTKGKAPRPFPKKELTGYKPALALKRARFYLDVLEAHFVSLGLVLEPKHEPARADEHAYKEDAKTVESDA